MSKEKNPFVEQLAKHIESHPDIAKVGYDSSDPGTLEFWVEPTKEMQEKIIDWFDEHLGGE